MSLRPPRLAAGVGSAVLLDALQTEIAQEKAQNLGRAARRLEAALATYHAAAATHEGGPDLASAATEAADALWAFVVQREACGLRDTEAALRAYAVPASLRARMGMRAARAG